MPTGNAVAWLLRGRAAARGSAATAASASAVASSTMAAGRRASSSAASATAAAGGAPRFAGQRAVVTGGTNGIGAAITRALAREGCSVVVLDRELPSGGDGKGKEPGVTYRAVDVSERDEVEAALAAVIPQDGRGIDVVVPNAAAFIFGDVTSASPSAWRRVLDVNVLGTANVCAAAMPHLTLAASKHRGDDSRSVGGSASIVIVSSISAFIAQRDLLPYATTKAAVLQMARNMAIDAAPRGVRVNAVCPGPILTSATAKHAASLGKSVVSIDVRAGIALPRS